MNKCPFLSIQKITKEVGYDANGKIVEQKEIPSIELKDCLEAQCEIFDAAAKKCALPTMESKLNKIQDLQAKLQKEISENISELSNASSNKETVSILKSIMAETKENKENTAASQLHLLKKTDSTNDILSGLKEKMASIGSVDLTAVQQYLIDLKTALELNQEKFTDILELMLEEQQKRASESGVLKEQLNPILKGISEIKEALVMNQNKFGDILELILEDQQRKASQVDRETELLAELSGKQDKIVETIGKGFNTDSLNESLSKTADKTNDYMKFLSEADAARQSNLVEIEKQLIKVQQNMLEILEGQRKEQQNAGDERMLNQANAFNDRGVMFFHRRELAAAEAEFRKALNVRPGFAEAYNNLGLTLSDQGKSEEAIAAFKKAIDLSPDAPEAYNNLGCLFRAKKDYQQAVELFNQSITKREDYTLAYFNLGVAYEELEKFELAIKAWEKALTLQPTHEEARRKLAAYRTRR